MEIAGAQKKFLNWMLEENTDRSKRINVCLHVLAHKGEMLLIPSQTKQWILKSRIIQPVLPWTGCTGLWCRNSEGDWHRFQPREGQWDVISVGQGISVWPASDSVPTTHHCLCLCFLTSLSKEAEVLILAL